MASIPKPAELRALEKEFEQLTEQKRQTTREGGEGDPQFLPWLERRLGEISPRMSALTQEWEKRKREAKKADKGQAIKPTFTQDGMA